MPDRAACRCRVAGLRARPRLAVWLCPIVLIVLAVPGLMGRAAEDDDEAQQAQLFRETIWPLLKRHCHECHAAQQQEAGLRLDSREALLQGGDSGPALVPGDIQQSLLIDAVRYGETVKMPPDKQLSAKQIEALEDWVRGGAVWPQSKSPARP